MIDRTDFAFLTGLMAASDAAAAKSRADRYRSEQGAINAAHEARMGQLEAQIAGIERRRFEQKELTRAVFIARKWLTAAESASGTSDEIESAHNYVFCRRYLRWVEQAGITTDVFDTISDKECFDESAARFKSISAAIGARLGIADHLETYLRWKESHPILASACNWLSVRSICERPVLFTIGCRTAFTSAFAALAFGLLFEAIARSIGYTGSAIWIAFRIAVLASVGYFVIHTLRSWAFWFRYNTKRSTIAKLIGAEGMELTNAAPVSPAEADAWIETRLRELRELEPNESWARETLGEVLRMRTQWLVEMETRYTLSNANAGGLGMQAAT